MLNNLSIRKKLALVALGPLILLLVLSGLRIRGDLSDASDATDTQARATVSALTGQLFEAVRAESVENQNAVAVRGLDLDEVRATTDTAIDRWIVSVGEFGSIDGGSLASLVADFNAHRADVAAQFATNDGAQAVYEADSAVLQTIVAFDGLLSQGADASAVDLRQSSDLTTVSDAAAQLQLLGMWSANAGVVPEELPAAIGASENAAESYGLRNAAELPIAEGSYGAIIDEFRGIAPGDAVGVSANDWRAASDARALQLSTARVGEVASASNAALDGQSDAQSAMRTTGLIALVGLITAVAAVILVANTFISALGALRDEANRLAEDDLPQLADSLSSGSPVTEVESERSIDSLGDDEFGEVAAGLVAIRGSAEGLGDHVASLQSGIADTYVNLARRNQSLVDRQIEAIDTLEAEERDSDRLALMYRVDHLATRMRRNAESLLVLADAKTPERHSPAVELREVLRVAIGEVEDYRRIIPIALDDLHVAGHRAQDLAHLLAELMENAAQHSPPGTAVDVSGGFDSSTGNYVITVLDHGTGIDAEQRSDLNRLLSTPPASTLTISHSIGLHVVSRLADSLGLEVELDHADGGGLIASVTVPTTVIADWARTAPAASTLAPMAAPSPAAPSPAPSPVAPMPVAEVFEAAPPKVPEVADPAASPIPEVVQPEAALDIPVESAPQADLASSVLPDPTDEDVAIGLEGLDSLVSLDTPETPAVPTIDMPELDLPSLGVEELAEVPPPSERAPQLDVFGNVVSEEAVSEEVVSEDQAFDPPPSTDATEVFSPFDTPPVEASQHPAVPTPPEQPPLESDLEPPAPELSTEPMPPAAASPVPEEFIPMPPATSVPAPAVPAAETEPPAPAEAVPPAPTIPVEPALAAQMPEVPAQHAPVAESVAPNAGVTAAGLVKRQRQSTESIPEVDLEADRTAPSQRTPDQVKNMLSRYKIGLERGRGAAGTDGE